MKNHCYASITLNNIGVSLMERYCYDEAHKTFDNALQVFFASQSAEFKAAWVSQLGNFDRCPSPAEIEHLLYRAKLYLSSESASEFLPPLVAVDMEDDCSSSISSVEEHKDRDSFIVYDQYGQDMSLNRPSGSVSTPFQKLGDTTESRNYLVYYREPPTGKFTKDVESTLLASILFNKGQACRCLGLMKRRDGPQASERMLDRASQLFYFSLQAAEGEGSSDAMNKHTRKYLEEIRSTSFHMANEAKRQTRVGTMSFSPKQFAEALSRIVLMMAEIPPGAVESTAPHGQEVLQETMV